MLRLYPNRKKRSKHLDNSCGPVPVEMQGTFADRILYCPKNTVFFRFRCSQIECWQVGLRLARSILLCAKLRLRFALHAELIAVGKRKSLSHVLRHNKMQVAKLRSKSQQHFMVSLSYDWTNHIVIFLSLLITYKNLYIRITQLYIHIIRSFIFIGILIDNWIGFYKLKFLFSNCLLSYLTNQDEIVDQYPNQNRPLKICHSQFEMKITSFTYIIRYLQLWREFLLSFHVYCFEILNQCYLCTIK